MCRSLPILVLCLMALPVISLACPLCGSSLEQNGQGWATGIFWSIFFMLGSLATVTGLVIKMMVSKGSRIGLPLDKENKPILIP